MVTFFNSDEEIVAGNIHCKPDKAYTLLADDSGFITNVSSNFKKKFIGSSEITNEDSKINIDDIF
jgi:hypothetical protein